MDKVLAERDEEEMEEAKKKLEEEDDKLAAKCQFHQNGAKLEVGVPPKRKQKLIVFS